MIYHSHFNRGSRGVERPSILTILTSILVAAEWNDLAFSLLSHFVVAAEWNDLAFSLFFHYYRGGRGMERSRILTGRGVERSRILTFILTTIVVAAE